MLAEPDMKTTPLTMVLFSSLLLIVECDAQAQDSCTSSFGIAYRPDGANYTAVPKYVRLFGTTVLSDSLPTYALVAADFSVNPFTSLISVEFGFQLTPMDRFNIRPHIGGGGLPIGGKKSYIDFPFLYGGVAVEVKLINRLYPGFSVNWFIPASGRDFLLYLRYGY